MKPYRIHQVETIEQESMLIIEHPVISQNGVKALIRSGKGLVLILLNIVSEPIRAAEIILNPRVIDRWQSIAVQVNLGFHFHKAGVIPVDSDRQRDAGKTPFRTAYIVRGVCFPACHRMRLLIHSMKIPP